MNGLDTAGENRPANALIIYRPAKARSQVTARLLGIARAALLIWGAASLAGVSAAAIAYGQGGLDIDLRTSVAPAPTLPAVVDLPPKVAAPPLAARLNSLRPVTSPPPAKLAAAPKPASAPRPATAPKLAAEPRPATASLQPAGLTGSDVTMSERSLSPPPGGEAMVDVSPLAAAEPLVAARIPQARPAAPERTGSIDRRYASQSPRRFRRLRDVPFLYRRTRDREDFAPYEDQRAPPQFFHYW